MARWSAAARSNVRGRPRTGVAGLEGGRFIELFREFLTTGMNESIFGVNVPQLIIHRGIFMSNQSLRGKVALVTGGSRGIGAAIARRLAAEGSQVALTYSSNPARGDELVAGIKSAGGSALGIQADSANEKDVSTAVEKAVKVFGRLDILVNNAGVAAIAPLEKLTVADFDRTFAINVRGVFIATQAALAHLPSGGRIINIGSCNSDRMPFAGGAIYAASKAALVGLVKGLARDLGPRGITVNNVHPGPVDTEMNPKDSDFATLLKTQFMALPRYGTGDEIAAFVAFLAGPEAAYITGANLMIDGGFTA
jgi:3-oxoacyl-[acyl-carrier protein] reductase